MENTAPSITPINPILPSISENDTSNSGVPIRDFLGISFTDPDQPSKRGIAIYGTGGSHGKWQYSTNDGTTWLDIGVVSTAAALLLRDADFVRWRPDGTRGTTGTLNYWGWDLSNGSAGSKESTYSRGESTAFSVASDTASIIVADVNDRPTGFDFELTGTEDAVLRGTLPARDVDGDLLYFLEARRPTYGLIEVERNGQYTYMPQANFYGDDSFSYTVSDGQSASTHTVSLVITPENDVPRFVNTIAGAVAIAFSQAERFANSSLIALQADEKLIAVSNSYADNQNIAIARIDGDGFVDKIFGNSGRVLTSYFDAWSMAEAAALQPDDKLIVAGRNDSATVMYRYLPDGVLDPTFGNNGRAALGINENQGNVRCGAVSVLADGRILVAGNFQAEGRSKFFVARFLSDGSVDPAFGNLGIVYTAAIGLGSQSMVANLEVQRDGKIIIGGRSDGSINPFGTYSYSGDFVILRYMPDGKPDGSFGFNGQLKTNFSTDPYYYTQSDDGVKRVLVLEDQNLLAVGYSGISVALAKYQADGNLDFSFGSSGQALHQHASAILNSVRDAELQKDGKIVVTGDLSVGGRTTAFISRFTPDGRLDEGFGEAGWVFCEAPSFSTSATDILLDGDGNIVLAMNVSSSMVSQLVLMRFKPDGIIDQGFGASKTPFSISRAEYIEDGSASIIAESVLLNDLELGSINNFAGSNLLLRRADGARPEDGFSATGRLSSLIEGRPLLLNGIEIGSVLENSSGSLSLKFNSNAWGDRLVETLRSIAYYYDGNNPPDYVDLQWQFSDGNSGSQGLGGEGLTTGGSRIYIAAQNDSPEGSVEISGAPREGETLVAIENLADPDGIGEIVYTWKANGVDIGSGNTITLTQSEVGKLITVTASYTDEGETAESVTSGATPSVVYLNDAPTLASPIADQSVNQNAAFTLQVSDRTIADVDPGDTLTYTATLADGSVLPAWLSFTPATRTFSGTPTNQHVGAIDVKVTATDGGDLSVSDVFRLTVVNVNDAPTVASPILEQSAMEDAAFTFQVPEGTFAEVDAGDTLTYAATKSDGATLPGWLSFAPSTRTFSGTPGNGDVGALAVKVTVTDSASASVSDEFTVTVANVNDAPTVANPIVDRTANEEAAFAFQVPSDTFMDIDAGDALTYTATKGDGTVLPAWLTFTPGTRTLSGTPANGDVGRVNVRVTATDGRGASASDDFTLTVANVNDAPSGSVTIGGTPREGELLTVSHTINDIDGLGPISYQWFSNGTQITGIEGNTLLLDSSHVGTKISVRAVYIDGGGTSETVSAAETASVASRAVPGKSISGSNGSDAALSGGEGPDTVSGLAGNDTLIGHGGDDILDGGADSDTAVFAGGIAEYVFTRQALNLTVADSLSTRDGTDTLRNIERVKFADMGVSLTVQTTAASIDQASLDRLCELYLGFFARVPAADGLENWINQFKNGKSLNTIADDFYGIGSSSGLRAVTGYWDSGNNRELSDQDFVKIAYRNVLGREGLEGGINYWANQLSGPEAKTRGELVATMLDAAQGLTGDATWGWVAELLDDKVLTSKRVAVEWGLNYGANATEAITKGVEIANAIKTEANPNPLYSDIPVKRYDFDTAIDLVGINPENIDLSIS